MSRSIRIGLALSLATLLVSSGCGPGAVVFVHLDADAPLREGGRTFSLLVRSSAGDVRYSRALVGSELRWPLTLPVWVGESHADEFSVIGTLGTLDGAVTTVAVVRDAQRGGHVWLYFREICVDRDCGDSPVRGCFQGVCRDACYVPTDLPSEPFSCDGSAGCTGCCAGDTCVEGRCVPPDGQRIDSIVYWWRHGCASSEEGHTWCWGRDVEQQVGDPESNAFQIPIYVGDVGRVRLRGPFHTCALSSSERTCWGSNEFGQLGLGSTAPVVIPTSRSDFQDWSEVWTGNGYTCGMTPDSELWCWGDNAGGQLAQPATVPSSSLPVRVLAADGSRFHADDLDTGIGFVIAIRDGEVWGWGQTFGGALGEAAPTGNVHVPTRISLPDGALARRVSAGLYQTCVLSSVGRIYCWGRAGPSLGRRSDDVSPHERSVEVPHPEEGVAWSVVSIGVDHACAIDDRSRLYCWGDNAAGQLGLGLAVSLVETPTRVLIPDWGEVSFATVSAGTLGTCATTTDGAALCWGTNAEGCIGVGELNAVVPTPRRLCLPPSP